MSKLILHIPHSSMDIPLKTGYTASPEELSEEVLKLTDWYTDDLFYSSDNIMIVANFSRIFCDVERFSNDELEIMAAKGMGVLYEKSDDGRTIRVVDPVLRERILKDYYWNHHNALSKAVKTQTELFSRALIIDCHSFPNIPLKRALEQNPNRPDFNIGTDSFHTPQKLIDISVEFFNDMGYSLGVDSPYSGSIVPMENYKKDKNVESIMLEINRRLYLNEPTNERSNRYLETKTITHRFIEVINTYHQSVG